MIEPNDNLGQGGEGLESLFVGASKGLVLPHDLTTSFDREVLRDRVHAYVRWAETRLPPACPAMFLSAANIDPEGLKRFLQQVIQGIYELAPPRHSQPAVSRESPQTDGGEKVLRVSQVLNGFLLLDEIVLGGGRRGVRRTGHSAGVHAGIIKDPTLSQDARARFAELAAPGINERAMDVYQRLLIPQLLSRKGRNNDTLPPSVFRDLGGAASERHRSLYDGLLMAADALDKKLSGDLLQSLDKDGDPPSREFVLAAKRTTRAIQQHEFTMRLDGLVDAAEVLRAAAEKWAEESLAKQNRGHVSNQRKVTMLRRHVAYVCQYSWLLFGNRFADDVIDVALQLSWLGRRLLKELQTFAGLKRDEPKDPPSNLLRGYDAITVRPDIVHRWRSALGDGSRLVGEFCNRLAGKQKEPWLGGHYVDEFLDLRAKVEGKRPGRKKPEDLSLRRRQEAFVNDLLAPMQGVGLAAQAPWDYLWDHAGDPASPLKSHDRGKWVINPFGLLLAGDNAG